MNENAFTFTETGIIQFFASERFTPNRIRRVCDMIPHAFSPLAVLILLVL